eukprot:Ihof_evm2s27 gene=Ihof_evmTU2s27
MAGNFWVSSHCNHWLLDKHEAELTKHDIKNYISDKELNTMKIFVADFTQQVGQRLKLRQQIVATAILYLRRFYSKNSYSSCEIPLLVITALYLASKVEENGNVQVRNFIQPTVSMLKKEFAEVYHDHTLSIDQSHIIEVEFYLLEELDCYTIVFNPYRDLIAYGQHGRFNKEAVTDAWYFLNDSYRTDLCIQYPPHLIALAALYMTTIIQDYDKRLDNQRKAETKAWFADLNVDLQQILDICKSMFEMYRLWDEYSLVLIK